MTANVQFSILLDVLKRKLQQSKERMEIYKEEYDECHKRLQLEISRRGEAETREAALNRRIQLLEEKLERSGERLATATAKLPEAEETDKKYKEVVRKLFMMELDLERAQEYAEHRHAKIVELEEELRVVGNNLKSLEASREKATQREESFEVQVKILSEQLKEAGTRADLAERSVQKLQKEVDRLEDDLVTQKENNNVLQKEMEASLHDIQNM